MQFFFRSCFNPLNAELNSICHLLALLGAHTILHVSRIRVNLRMCLCIQHILPSTRLLTWMHERNIIKLHVQAFLRMEHLDVRNMSKTL